MSIASARDAGGRRETQSRGPEGARRAQGFGPGLYAELRPHVPPEQRFKTLVAANVCAVVAREIRAGEEGSVQDLRLFEALLGSKGGEPVAGEAEPAAREAARELARAIRSGDLDGSIEEVVSALRDHVRRKLEIARPGYAD